MNLSATQPNAHESADAESKVEYSAREVCPPALLLQQILRAHRIFLLHHAPSLADLYARFPRPRFCYILKRYWDNFVLDWELLLNGNPAVDVFNGLKLAAGGELGIGVGEEEWGSGEREVLEDFVRRTDGLVDLIVSRFGDTINDERAINSQSSQDESSNIEKETVDGWQGGRQHPKPSDGVIFSGVGAITRASARDVASWVELLYKYGQRAYGVQENPAAVRRRKRERPPDLHQSEPFTHTSPSTGRRKLPIRKKSHKATANTSSQRSLSPPNIPPPIVRSSHLSADIAKTSPPVQFHSKGAQQDEVPKKDDSLASTDMLMKYLTLGVYGSTWGIPSRKVPIHEQVSKTGKESGPSTVMRNADNNTPDCVEHSRSCGHFLIGLQGGLDQEVNVADHTGEKEAHSNQRGHEEGSNERTMLRTLHVRRHKQKFTNSSTSLEDSGNENSSDLKR